MVKKIRVRRKKQAAKAPQPRKGVAQRAMVQRSVLDSGAAAWARLLADPCAAPLTYPCYPTGTGGSVLMRFESDFLFATGATEVAGIFGFCPGSLGGFSNATPLTSDILGTVLTLQSTSIPGFTFINANTNSYRPVAACMQVMYPGTELNRSGVVGVGICSGDVLLRNVNTVGGGSNINTNASEVRTMCQHVERMPTTVVEIKWFPGTADEENNSTQGLKLGTLTDIEGRNTIFMSASGFPVSTGIRIRMVAVYELSFGAGAGQIAGSVAPTSGNTPAQVVRALTNRDADWYISSAAKIGKAVGNTISYVATGYKAASAFAAGLALI